MLAIMGQSADALFATVNAQLLRIFEEAEAAAAAGGGQPPSRGAKYALNIMLQGMNVPSIAAGLTQVQRDGWRGGAGARGGAWAVPGWAGLAMLAQRIPAQAAARPERTPRAHHPPHPTPPHPGHAARQRVAAAAAPAGRRPAAAL